MDPQFTRRVQNFCFKLYKKIESDLNIRYCIPFIRKAHREWFVDALGKLRIARLVYI